MPTFIISSPCDMGILDLAVGKWVVYETVQ